MSEASSANLTTGLCGTCRYMRQVVSGKGSRFFYCSRSETDERYTKYPRLPVSHCPGYDSKTEDPLLE